MPSKVEAAVKDYLPGLLEGKATGLPAGKRLTDLADQMELAPREAGARLTAEQTETQQIIGALKFIEKVMPKITLGLHRLSCVMSSPPPEANVVAKAALATLGGRVLLNLLHLKHGALL